MIDKINRWCYGGQDKEFFISNEEHIEKNNFKVTKLLINIVGIISVLYYVVASLVVGNFIDTIDVLVFGLIIFIFSVVNHYLMHPSIKYMKVITQLTICVFSLFLLHYNFSERNELAVMIPVYLAAMATIYVYPMHIIVSHELAILTILAIGSIVFKPSFLFKDITDGVICAFIGIVIGQRVLMSRTSEIVLLNRIRRDVREKDAKINVAMDLANTDGLTGIKNKNAYTQTEEAINARLRAGEQLEFAIVVCDVNDLKKINDDQGHVEGDKLICDAASMICDIFKHSPVFRIGGDEFVAILMDSDYSNRFRLYSQLNNNINNNIQNGNVTFACGMSIYESYKDKEVVDVFKRADHSMYNDKRRLHTLVGTNERI